MGFFDNFLNGGNEDPNAKIKEQIAAAGVNPAGLSFAFSGTTMVVSGLVASQTELDKLRAFAETMSKYMSIQVKATVKGAGGKVVNNNEEEEEYDEEEGDEDYDLSVLDVQIFLESAGYELGKLDGVWGPKTASALKHFQKDYELDKTGEVDDETAEALVAAFNDAEELPVAVVQHILDDSGYKFGAIDGIWGPKTKLALKNFQEEYELDPTGSLDEDTIEALKEAYLG
jgi:peptidoglycan hydrolase-like protein with peptidoglycan-binding domain